MTFTRTLPHRIRRLRHDVLLALASLALTACGGGGGGAGPATGTAAPTAAEAGSLAVGVALTSTASTVGMTKVWLTNSDGQSITGFVFRDPAATSRQAAVVLMHGCAGIWSNGVINTSAQPPQTALSHIHRRWGTELARAGYTVMLVDSFTERNLPNECNNGSAGLNEAVVRPRDAAAGRQWLLDNTTVAADRIALMGWSNGASAVLATMDSTNRGAPGARPFKEAFAFYPGCGLLSNFGGDATTTAKTTWLPYAPVTIHHADQDPLYTDGRCANRVSVAQTLGAGTATGNAVAMQVHAGARHSFDQIDLAKALVSPYTAADQTAQTAADAAVMQRLATLFPN